LNLHKHIGACATVLRFHRRLFCWLPYYCFSHHTPCFSRSFTYSMRVSPCIFR
jgi:hypothetical protein